MALLASIGCFGGMETKAQEKKKLTKKREENVTVRTNWDLIGPFDLVHQNKNKNCLINYSDCYNENTYSKPILVQRLYITLTWKATKLYSQYLFIFGISHLINNFLDTTEAFPSTKGRLFLIIITKKSEQCQIEV